MALQNVEKTEQQEVHKKTWFQRFSGKAAATGAIVTGAVVASSNALALCAICWRRYCSKCRNQT